MTKPKYMFPRFYFKKVGGNISIEHRLTHHMIGSVNTEEELKAELKRLNKMSEEDLWRHLIYERRLRVPNQKQSLLAKKSHANDENEEWFLNAWSIYTDLFYMQNPKLLVVEEHLPSAIINKIRKEQYEEEKAADEKRRKEIEDAERLSKLDEKSAKKEVMKKKKEEPEATGKFGNPASLERLKVKKKVKKLRIKTKANKVIDFIDDDDPFA
jgi:hypothetical protein